MIATSSPNYTVLAENPGGLLFKNKKDRKVLNVDPTVSIFLNIQFRIRKFCLPSLRPIALYRLLK